MYLPSMFLTSPFSVAKTLIFLPKLAGHPSRFILASLLILRGLFSLNAEIISFDISTPFVVVSSSRKKKGSVTKWSPFSYLKK